MGKDFAQGMKGIQFLRQLKPTGGRISKTSKTPICVNAKDHHSSATNIVTGGNDRSSPPTVCRNVPEFPRGLICDRLEVTPQTFKAQ